MTYGKMWKAEQIDWNVVSQFDDIVTVFQCLTQRQQNILIMSLSVLKWRTRWINLPEDNDLSIIDELIAKLMENTTCCDAIAKCLLEPGIREIIREIIKEGGGSGGGGQTGGGGVNTCDPDVIFGGVSYIVDYLIAKGNDFFEDLEVATNLLEIADEWTNIGGAVVAPLAPLLVDYLAWLQETVAENWASAVTVEYTNLIKCELFCLYVEKCPVMLTWEEVGQYFWSRVSEESFIENMADLMTFFIGGFWTGTQYADIVLSAMIAFQIIEDGIGWLNISSLGNLDTQFALGANDPSSDWSILCEECNVVYQYCWFIDGNTPAWIPTHTQPERHDPVYDATEKWFYALSSDLDGTGKYGVIDFDLGAEYSTVQVIAHASVKATRDSSGYFVGVSNVDGSQAGSFGANSIGVHEIDIDHTMTNTQFIRIAFNTTTNTASESQATSYSRITFIRVIVTGTESPFPENNCPLE